MLKMILFICLLPFALMEVFFYKQFGIVVVGFLYFMLSLQADRAANKFLRDGFRWSIPTRQSERRRRLEEAAEDEHIAVDPLSTGRAEGAPSAGSQPGQPGFYTSMRTDPKPEEVPVETVRLTRPSMFRIGAQTTTTASQAGQIPPASEERPALPAAPNYRGRAHEVLAVPENAATRTIKRAFRFWIKKVHPDHNGGAAGPLSNMRVQRITEAKDLLLERRRTKRSA